MAITISLFDMPGKALKISQILDLAETSDREKPSNLSLKSVYHTKLNIKTLDSRNKLISMKCSFMLKVGA